MRKKSGFTTFHLKIIALVFMVIDHIGEFIEGTPLWFRYIGRCSAPIFLFCLCWGLDYTKNRKKYLLRLYIASIIMAVLWRFFRYGMDVQVDHENNIFSTLFITAVFITLLFSGRWKTPYAFLLILLWQAAAVGISFFLDATVPSGVVSAVTGCAFSCEGGIKWCVLGCLIYHIKNNKKMLAAGYAGWCLLCEFFLSVFAPIPRILYFLEWHMGTGNILWQMCSISYSLIADEDYHMTPIVPHGLYFGSCQWMMIGALPFMLMYNHQRGRACKYMFYIFYPLHIFLLITLAYFDRFCFNS